MPIVGQPPPVHAEVVGVSPENGALTRTIRALEDLAEALGVEPRARHGSRVQVAALVDSLTSVARDARLISDPWFPHDLLRRLGVVAQAIPPSVWRGTTPALSDEELALLSLLEGLARDAEAKLGRWSRLWSRSASSPSPLRSSCGSEREIVEGTVVVADLTTSLDGPSACGVHAGSPGAFFRYVAPRDGVASFSTTETSSDTVLSLRANCEDGEARELVCNDDDAFSLRSRAALAVEAGDVIRVWVSALDGDSAPVVLSAEINPGITGRVRSSADGTAVPDADVWIFEERIDIWSYRAIVTTGAEGRYVAGGLEPGTYYVVARHPDFVDQLYEGLPCVESFGCSVVGATPVTVGEETVTEIDLDLSRTGRISGRVSGRTSDGEPPLGNVVAGRMDGRRTTLSISPPTAPISLDGSYQLEGLAPGEYWVRTDVRLFSDEVYDDVPCAHDCDPVATGQSVPVQESMTTEGVDFALAAAGAIEGTVTSARVGAGLADVQVWVQSDPQGVRESAQTDAEGRFEVPYLDPGRYGLYVCEPGYFAEIFEDVPLAKPCWPPPDTALGTLVDVIAASTTSGIVLDLRSEASILGTVREKGTLRPLAPEVRAYQDGSVEPGELYTFSGRYLLEGLSPGDYLVWGDSAPRHHQGEWYDDVQCRFLPCEVEGEDPQALPLDLGGVATGIDFLLSPCTHPSFRELSGRFNAPNGYTACEQITVDAVRIESGGELRLTAGRSVVLRDGFQVETGGRLWIVIDPTLSGQDPR